MKGHTFVHIEEHQASTDTTSTIPDIMCRKHPDQPIKVYCGDCGVAACLQCGITQHNGHSILELEAAKEEQLPVMASLVTAVQEGVPKAAAAVTDVQDGVKQLRANKVAADAAVEASFRKKAQILLARKNKVLKTIETIEVEKKQVLEDRITEFETTTESSEGGTAVAECILEHGSPAEIMIARPSLTSGLGKLIKEHQTHLAPKHKDIKLDFVDNMPDLEAQLDTFGKIAIMSPQQTMSPSAAISQMQMPPSGYTASPLAPPASYGAAPAGPVDGFANISLSSAASPAPFSATAGVAVAAGTPLNPAAGALTSPVVSPIPPVAPVAPAVTAVAPPAVYAQPATIAATFSPMGSSGTPVATVAAPVVAPTLAPVPVEATPALPAGVDHGAYMAFLQQQQQQQQAAQAAFLAQMGGGQPATGTVIPGYAAPVSPAPAN